MKIYHNKTLKIDKNGKWKIEDNQNFQPDKIISDNWKIVGQHQEKSVFSEDSKTQKDDIEFIEDDSTVAEYNVRKVGVTLGYFSKLFSLISFSSKNIKLKTAFQLISIFVMKSANVVSNLYTSTFLFFVCLFFMNPLN